MRYANAGIGYMRDIAKFPRMPYADVVMEQEAHCLERCGLGAAADIEERLTSLCRRHCVEWRSFVEQYPEHSYLALGAF